jgi:hypothetical protein
MSELTDRLRNGSIDDDLLDAAKEAANEIDRLQARVAHLEQLITDATYTLSKARMWGGMEWTYNPLHPMYYAPMRDRLAAEADAIYAAREPK